MKNLHTGSKDLKSLQGQLIEKLSNIQPRQKSDAVYDHTVSMFSHDDKRNSTTRLDNPFNKWVRASYL